MAVRGEGGSLLLTMHVEGHQVGDFWPRVHLALIHPGVLQGGFVDLQVPRPHSTRSPRPYLCVSGTIVKIYNNSDNAVNYSDKKWRLQQLNEMSESHLTSEYRSPSTLMTLAPPPGKENGSR